MGAGASVEGGDQIEDQMYAQKSSAAMTGDTSAERSKTSLVSNSNVIKGSNNLLVQRSKILADGTEAVIHVAKTGFSEHEVTVIEGQVVDFIWEETTSNMSLVQVVHDGEKLRPVIGGYQVNPDECGGLYHQQFNIEGEYKFALSGIRCTPVTVNVKRKMDLEARVTDNGFQPSIIHVDQGHAITWSWKNCSVPHTMQEVTFLMDRGCFKKQSTNPSMVATVTGGYRQQFQRTGLYYFLTESGQEVGKTHLCIVHVLDAIREYKLEILDRSFQPMILLIEEGDRVWFLWDKFKCKKSHSIYQIEAPPIGYSDQEPYIPTKDGFRWSAPSKQGLLSHQFHKAGVFYFSDQNFDEAAEYIGTIIVKPKQKEHIVNLTEKGFIPDLLYAYTGDRVWWTWNGDSVTDLIENLLIVEEDKCLNPAAKNKPASPISEDLYHVLDGESAGLMTRVGLATNHFTTIGVYHYRIAETDESVNTCSIIINPGSKNNTVHLTDNGFEPKVLTIRPNDRVWWVWQSCKKQHNILQVSHQGGRIDGGFSSGQPRDSPSAYVYQFISPGVYYFISANLPKLFGAIVVSTQPQVHEVTVSNTEIYPDPVTVQTNDIVCWVFRQPQFYDINQIETLDQLLDGQMSENLFSPRRCIGRAVSTSGSIHLVSKSFQKKKVTITDQVKLSSVICDDRYDNTTIRVDKKGFHPSKVYLNTGQSVLWNWKGTDEEHLLNFLNKAIYFF
ncbi:uncharacterized protein LOC126828357 [Patella vulgata]|uniref:uncharacterized protein LOC126828357 n=1 Tax=Patella vulgata TaxID=6465 RepID=UPI0024A98903|nr:uncharacterized protein LOC126828357 [Patella vulgata]